MASPTLINQNTEELHQKLLHYLFIVNSMEIATLLLIYLIKYVFQINHEMQL